MVTDLILPDRRTFTREQLAERWECDLSLIDSYIKDGQLKEGFDTFGSSYSHLREMWYCVLEDDGWSTEKLLDAVEDGKPLSEFTSAATTFTSCPRYLYMPPVKNTIGKIKEPNPFNLVGGILFLCSFYDVPIRYFHDRHGNVLIPTKKVDDEDYITFPAILKRNFRNFIIPLEEVLRFENECRVREKEDVPYATGREGKSHEKKQDSNTASSKAIDNAAEDKQPPAPENILRMSDVVRRTGISKSQVHNMMNDGRFPKSFPLVPGGRAVGWYESVIDEWIRERNQRKQNDGEADE